MHFECFYHDFPAKILFWALFWALKKALGGDPNLPRSNIAYSDMLVALTTYSAICYYRQRKHSRKPRVDLKKPDGRITGVWLGGEWKGLSQACQWVAACLALARGLLAPGWSLPTTSLSSFWLLQLSFLKVWLIKKGILSLDGKRFLRKLICSFCEPGLPSI